jgi:hypothetical protein
MHGLWCHAGEVGKKTSRYVRGKCKKEMSDSYLEVGVGTVGGHEWDCDIRKIVVVGQTYKISSKCGGEGMRSNQEATVWVDGRFLFYRFDRTSNEYPEQPTMACRNHRSTPPDADPDPVVITLLTFDDTFGAAHTTRSGKTYVRGDQYRDIKVWTGDSANEVYWSGVSKRNPNKRMTGSLVTAGDDYRYTEKTYNGGRLETTVVSNCASADGG